MHRVPNDQSPARHAKKKPLTIQQKNQIAPPQLQIGYNDIWQYKQSMVEPEAKPYENRTSPKSRSLRQTDSSKESQQSRLSSRKSGRRMTPVKHRNISRVRDSSDLKMPKQKPTNRNDLQSRLTKSPSPKRQAAPRSVEAPVVKSSAEIFRAIHHEKHVLSALPKRKGNLKVQILSRNQKRTELKQVYCYLRNKQLKFYKDSSMMDMEGIIDFDLVQSIVTLDDDYVCFGQEEGLSTRQICRLDSGAVSMRSKSAMPNKNKNTPSGPTMFRIEVRATDLEDQITFIFQAASSKAVLMWFNAIVTNWSAGKPQIEKGNEHIHLSIPRMVPDYWRKGCIRAERMNEIADSGDIIFFSSNQLFAGMQRLVTSCDYDHTAMFLRFATGQLIYFESASNIGVQIFRWEYFFEHELYKNFPRMAFRKVRCGRDLGKLGELEEFVNSVRGKDYNLDLATLMRKTGADDDTENIPDQKTYFCSELVAAAHKVLEILPKDVPASQYWPSTFTRASTYLNNELVAKGSDAYYEDLQEIIFD